MTPESAGHTLAPRRETPGPDVDIVLKARHPSETSVERGFVPLAHGSMHFRAGGSGPVVLALHESPRSSLSMLPVIDALSDHRRVIAPDTPGYGLSDPLSEPQPEMDRFVAALIAFLDALGLERVMVYGAHTGAALGLALADRHPERVAGLVLDGVSAFDTDEVEAFRSRYLVPYTPTWDGAHVMRLWSRVRDLYTWFPWYEQNATARLRTDPPDLDALQRSVLGFVQSSAHYAKAYIRAAAFDPNAVIPGLRCRLTVMAKPDDLIADHLDRIRPGPGWILRRLGSDSGAWRTALRQAVIVDGAEGDTQRPGTLPSAGKRFLLIGEGWLNASLAGPTDGPVRLLIPGLPGDLAAFTASQAREHPGQRIVGFSPPGCGRSDPLAEAGGLSEIVDVLAAGLAQLGLDPPESIAGEGAGVVIAQLWAERAHWSARPEPVEPPAWLSPNVSRPPAPLLEPLAPRWDGAHLTSAWFQVRDMELYDYPPGSGTPMRGAHTGRPDVDRIERRFRSFVEGPECACVLRQVIESLR